MKKILTILFFIIAELSIGQVYTIPKDSITSWRTKATQRNATLAEYEEALIYKNIQGSYTTAVQNSTLTAIKRGIDTLNQTERQIKRKLDTLCYKGQIVKLSYTLQTGPGTFTTAAQSVISNGSLVSNTISLPNGNYKLVSAVITPSNAVINGLVMYCFNGTVTSVANNAFNNITIYDAQKLQGDLNFSVGQFTGFARQTVVPRQQTSTTIGDFPIYFYNTNNMFSFILTTTAVNNITANEQIMMTFYLQVQ